MSWADVSSDAMSEGESSGDDIPQWTEVRRKRKREVGERDNSVSPSPSSIPLPTGKPPVLNENTEAMSGAFKKKCGADVRPRGGRGIEGTVFMFIMYTIYTEAP